MAAAFPLRVAIAGVGAMGREHARVVRRLATLVAVADTSAAARAAFAGIPAYSTLSELLQRERVDVVHVCTPSATHEELGAAVLQAGCHLFAEKPFADTASGAEWLVRLAEARGLRVCAGHQLLFEPAARRALGELDRIDPLVHAESFYSTAGAGSAELRDLLLHPLYVLLHALETAAPHEEAALAGLHVAPSGTVHALVRRGHVTGTLVVTPEGRPVESFLRLVGTRGTVTADFVRGTVQRLMGPGASAAQKAANPLRLAGQLAGGTLAALARRALDPRRTYPGVLPLTEAFYRSILGGPAPLSARGIVETLRIWEPIAAALPAPAPGATSTPAHHP